MPKQIWVTNLRVLATLSVILLHASGGGIFSYNTIPLSWYWICNLTNSFGFFAVPCFVMLSGYLLLGRYDGNLVSFLQKRFTRVWLPFTLWIGIYLAYRIFYEHRANSISTCIQKYLGGDVLYGHLWFVYMILGMYLLTPYLSRWLKTATQQEVYFFLFLSFISASIFPLITKITGFPIKFDLQNFGGYIGYYVAGYVLGNADTSAYKKYYPFIFLSAWLLSTFGNYYETMNHAGKYQGNFYNYLSPNIIIDAVAIFLAFKHWLNIEILPKVTNLFDKYSYGIYLVHELVLRHLSRVYHINWIYKHPLIGISLQTSLTIVLSTLIILLLSKLPKGYWITG
jgi:surface polysaccharide O-acyltransferase-like enzyme